MNKYFKKPEDLPQIDQLYFKMLEINISDLEEQLEKVKFIYKILEKNRKYYETGNEKYNVYKSMFDE
jgi:hypothetical protein